MNDFFKTELSVLGYTVAGTLIYMTAFHFLQITAPILAIAAFAYLIARITVLQEKVSDLEKVINLKEN